MPSFNKKMEKTVAEPLFRAFFGHTVENYLLPNLYRFWLMGDEGFDDNCVVGLQIKKLHRKK